MAPNELKKRLSVAVKAARAAGQLTLAHYHSGKLVIDRKSDDSPVTQADREAEEFLRRRIESAFPEDGILGEEDGEKKGSNGCRWILDPIDGTESFIRKVPQYGTMVGLEVDGEAVLGVIVLPVLQETVYAARGLGAKWLPPARSTPVEARISSVSEMKDALVLTTSATGIEKTGRGAGWRALLDGTRESRGWGDCYGHVLVATGRAEIMVDPVMKIWDCAALKPILEEAGGRFTDLEGHATIDGGNALSSNGVLHDGALSLLSSR